MDFDAYNNVSNRSKSIHSNSSINSSNSSSSSSCGKASYNQIIEPDNQIIEPDNQIIEPDNQIIEPDNQIIEPDSISRCHSLLDHDEDSESRSSIIEEYLKFESEGNVLDFRRNSITDFKKLDFELDNNLPPHESHNKQSTLEHKCTNSISCQIL